MDVNARNFRVLGVVELVGSIFFLTHYRFYEYARVRKIFELFLVFFSCAVITFFYIQSEFREYIAMTSFATILIRESFLYFSAVINSSLYIEMVDRLKSLSSQLRQRTSNLRYYFPIVLFGFPFTYFSFGILRNMFSGRNGIGLYVFYLPVVANLFFVFRCERLTNIFESIFNSLIVKIQRIIRDLDVDKLYSHHVCGECEQASPIEELESIVACYNKLSICCDMFNSIFCYSIYCCISLDLFLCLDTIRLLWEYKASDILSLHQKNAYFALLRLSITLVNIAIIDRVPRCVERLRCALARLNNVIPLEGQLKTVTKSFLYLISDHPPSLAGDVLQTSVIPIFIVELASCTIIMMQLIGAL